MSFVYPWVLLFLAIPILLFWTVIARQPGVVMPFDHQEHGRGGGRLLRFSLGVFDAAPLLLLALAITILAGPQLLKPSRKERELTNIQICMDVSGSMSGTRYQRASEAITDFTKAREGDAFGLMIFGSAQMRWIPITRDLDAIRNAMPFADPQNQPVHMGGTLIGAALKYAIDLFEAETTEGDRLIILVSDGDSSDLDGGAADEIADQLKAARITVYHIHVAEGEVPAEVADIARITGGQAMAASDSSSLKEVFRHIDRMKPAKFKPVGTAPLDHFGPFAIAALCLLGMHTLGLLGARYTPW